MKLGNLSITQDIMRNVIRESVSAFLREVVYVSDADKKTGKARLTYKKSSNWGNGNLMYNDKLKTDKMDTNDDDTYEVPLKGGIISYNITSISGKEVMHYFKRHFKNEDTNVEIDGKKYKLLMADDEFRAFIDQFCAKVNAVIHSAVERFREDGNFGIEKISIYPVPSSSNFNTKMANIMALGSHLGYETTVIDENLFLKDLRNLQKDEEFITKNQDFYSGSLTVGTQKPLSITSYVDSDINRAKKFRLVPSYVNKLNSYAEQLNKQYYAYNSAVKKGQTVDGITERLVDIYKEYHDTIKQCLLDTEYESDTKDNGKASMMLKSLMQQAGYTKPASVNQRTSAIAKVIFPELRNEVSPVTHEPYMSKPSDIIDIQGWEPVSFQIKNLPNSERLALKNIYNPNTDEALVQNELEKIKGTIFIIFDDNISGGATLSDICYQAKQLGIEYIVPITFGKMTEKNSAGGITYRTPKSGYNLEAITRRASRMVSEAITKEQLEPIKVLWLDDMRNPNSYFNKKSDSGAFIRNSTYYKDNIFGKYAADFVWVRNMEEFTKYILDNGLPDMISFDHDLGKGLQNGHDCAMWLMAYCKEHNLGLPKCFVHSANHNKRAGMNELLGLPND